MGWEAGGAEGSWETSFVPYICSAIVLFYHPTYLVYLTIKHEHMTSLPQGKLFSHSLYGFGQVGGDVLPDWYSIV